jgi:hypothetical protein
MWLLKAPVSVRDGLIRKLVVVSCSRPVPTLVNGMTRAGVAARPTSFGEASTWLRPV